MKYERQIEEIVKYFRSGEKNEEDFRIGIEMEHFVIDRDNLKTISYYGKNGVAETLKELENNGWEGIYEGEYLLGLNNHNKVVTLEPGSQLELSIVAQKCIKDIESEYFSFLEEIAPILDKKNQAIIATAYHPETLISEIEILPKKRYDYMFNYFKDKGVHAHNMMKGTASLQLAFDFKTEEDYIKKFKVASALSPAVYALYDNGYYFEGKPWTKHNLRAHIWENCDKDRSGVVYNAFDKDFGYGKYAEYILNGPAIFIDNGKELIFTGNTPYKDIFDPDNYSIEELEHVLTMFFPDVRTKKYIEVRMMDAVPYPLNLSAMALWKGILYNENNLNKVYNHVKNINMEDIVKAKLEIIEKGLDGKLRDESIYEICKWLAKIAKDGLAEGEKEYLVPLEKMLERKITPYDLVAEKQDLGKREALKDSILNDLIEVK